jgi:hypothetical protein
MSSIRVAFGVYWFCFALFFLLLQYIFNKEIGGFAVAASCIGSIPVAIILAAKGRQKP